MGINSALPFELVLSHEMMPSVAVASAILVVLSLVLLLLRGRSGGAAAGKGSSSSVASGTQHKGTATGAAEQEAPDNRPRCMLLFGTQTGTAERFAKDLRMQLTQRYGDSMKFETGDLEEYDAEERLASEKLVFFLVATYGDGEPTDNAATFYEWLVGAAGAAEQEGATPFEGVNYGVFGLGNKQYEHFCAIGKHMHSAMQALGATPIVRRGDGDDDDDIDADFEAWCVDLFAALDKSALVAKQQVAEVNAADLPAYVVEELPRGTAEAKPPAPGTGADHSSLFPARVLTVRELHGAGSGRSCVHVELDVKGSRIRYEAGDHVAVYAENRPHEVERAAQLLGADPDSIVRLSLPTGNPGQLDAPFALGPISLRRALARHADLTGPVHKQQLASLAAFATDPAEAARLRRLASPEGKDEFYAYCHEAQRCLLDVMADHRSARPSLGAFFGCVAGRLQPRFYSISSSPKAHPTQVHATCAVVSEKTPAGRHHEGVASSWLARLAPGDTVHVYTRASTFRLPRDPSLPVVMVGPGTGLAPFRGFLQERAALAAKGTKLGPAVLYFGCRNRRHDFIYQEELLAWAGSSTDDDDDDTTSTSGNGSGAVLTRLHTAFSREGPAKDYVQHHMVANASDLWAALGPSGRGSLYVCGDAKHMAWDVHRALHEAVIKATGCSGHEAEAAVKELADSGRYHKDVW